MPQPEPENHHVNRGNALPDRTNHRAGRGLAALSLAALGVVFGDIGTSPLYAVRECFHGEYGITPTPANILGVLSLMFWALIIIVTLKYLTFILRADNHGEGGVIALTSLIRSRNANAKRSRWMLVALGLFGASVLYGDGMITPAISVLSAVEGIRIITPDFKPYIIPATIIILAGLFALQHRGTARMGTLFGPVILVWFCCIAVIGSISIARHPQVLAAILPWHGILFLLNNHVHGFLVLGAVFLVVTGAEALYADLGHFGRKPIRLAWLGLAFPALLLNYFGQGALLIWKPEEAHHPFYALVPSWALIPMVILATAATIIASQAVITGAYSLTRQAIRLGYLPRLRIVHTSAKHFGQVYVPFVNWILMLATISLVLGLRSSSKLAAAYGVAVTSTMLIATILFYVVARERWGWSRPVAAVPALLFLCVDIAFWGANVSKLFHGAWFPLLVGGIVFTLMVTWRRGRELLAAEFKTRTTSWEEFQKSSLDPAPQRVNGNVVYMSGSPDVVPLALLHNLAHNKVLHSNIALLHIAYELTPRVPYDQKVEVAKLGQGFHKIVAHYGFMEVPSISNILSLAHEKGVDFKIDKTSFFLGREKLLPSKGGGMSLWRKKLFSFMSRNALDVSTFYDLPADRVVEVGIQLRL